MGIVSVSVSCHVRVRPRDDDAEQLVAGARARYIVLHYLALYLCDSLGQVA